MCTVYAVLTVLSVLYARRDTARASQRASPVCASRCRLRTDSARRPCTKIQTLCELYEVSRRCVDACRAAGPPVQGHSNRHRAGRAAIGCGTARLSGHACMAAWQAAYCDVRVRRCGVSPCAFQYAAAYMHGCAAIYCPVRYLRPQRRCTLQCTGRMAARGPRCSRSLPSSVAIRMLRCELQYRNIRAPRCNTSVPSIEIHWSYPSGRLVVHGSCCRIRRMLQSASRSLQLRFTEYMVGITIHGPSGSSGNRERTRALGN
jgi:hypothetical protein